MRIKQLVLDLNVTIALDGKIIQGVAERLDRLYRLLDVFIVNSDTRGDAERVTKGLKAKLHKIKEGDECAQKLELVRKIGQRGTVSIGNGSNDVLMLKESLLGVCILGREGTSGDAIMVADIIIADINDALDLLLNPDRLVDTLRK
ncbi:MAG: ATPase P [Candidatus Aenigmatarchaeota archaeon]|nr:MAG: ATPase P [Candidatus Aenigmarchaeota archaeon]